MKTDGLILDIDGTLWNSTGIVADAWNQAVSEHGYTYDIKPDDLKRLFGKTMDVIALALFPELSDEERDSLMKRCAELEQKYLEEDECKIAYEGVVDTIKEISGRLPVFIVSNCQSGYIELVSDKLKIEEFITDFECFGNTGKGKAENLATLCRRNNLKKPVYVGDTDGDSEACAEAKVPFIFASYGFGNTENFALSIESFKELKDCLEPV